MALAVLEDPAEAHCPLRELRERVPPVRIGYTCQNSVAMLQGIGNSPLCRSDWRCGQRGDIKMKRLFSLKYQNGQIAQDKNGQPYYFDNKRAAKMVRDTLKAGFKVSIGPDHWRYQG